MDSNLNGDRFKIEFFSKSVSAKIKEFEQKEVSMDELDSKKSNYCKESLLKLRFNEVSGA